MRNEKSPEIICDIFTQRMNNNYDPRDINYFETPFVRTVYNGTEPRVFHIWDFGRCFKRIQDTE